MRAATLAGIGLLLTLGAVGGADTKFPYELVVGERGVDVRSGPGAELYCTDHLAPGTKIEVHRAAGDWLAIRPPTGSYSWIRQSQVQRTTESGVGKVTEDGAICRIGSRVVATPDYISQVRLRKDEPVEILAEQAAADAANAAAAEGWCRIAPPAGEFRYVRSQDVAPAAAPTAAPAVAPVAAPVAIPPAVAPVAIPPAAAAPAAETRSGPVVAVPEPPKLNSLLHGMRAPAETPAPPPTETATTPPEPTQESGAWQARPGRPPRSSESDSTAALPATASPAAEQVRIEEPPERPIQPKVRVANDAPPTANRPAVAAKAAEESPRVPPENARSPESSSTTASPDAKPLEDPSKWTTRDRWQPDDLRQVELELSLIVSQPVRAWRLEPLRKRVEAALAKLTVETEKASANDLLRRIREFEQLEDRLVQSGIGVAPNLATDPRFTAATQLPAPVSARFDGTGWLVSVHSPNRAAPPYALLNAEGEVLQYISPTPGLNLHRYARKQVGIYGQRSAPPALNKPHLTAERVVDLERHRR